MWERVQATLAIVTLTLAEWEARPVTARCVMIAIQTVDVIPSTEPKTESVKADDSPTCGRQQHGDTIQVQDDRS